MWWRGTKFGRQWSQKIRHLSSTGRRQPVDEGDWCYSSEWWGKDYDSGDGGHTVFRANSDHGNGLVSVIAYPSSRPEPEYWADTEKWLDQRYAKIYSEFKRDCEHKIVGYQWRVLRFNDNTRQSISKVMASCRKSDPNSILLMQQPHCLAVPYLKSMVSTGLTALASSNYDLVGASMGKRPLNVLCVGHGGGSLPLFIASKIRGAMVDIVEIDPVVISASVQAMGFPSSAIKENSDKLPIAEFSDTDNLLWEGVHERLSIHIADAAEFIECTRNVYDLVLIDAYDGDDIFPYKLWDPEGPFLKTLHSKVHPSHGAVVVNLHSDVDVSTSEINNGLMRQSILPLGKHVMQVCQAYKQHFGSAFSVSVPWLCNSTLVATCGLGIGNHDRSLTRDLVLTALTSKSHLVDSALNLPFPCLQYTKYGFFMLD